VNNDYYKWVIESIVVNSTTYYRIKNIGTSRYFHTGNYGDYYGQDGDNNACALYAWNSSLVSGATALNNASQANREMSYYCFTIPSYSSSASFVSQIVNQRFAWGQRPLHGELSGAHTNSPRPTYVFFTNNSYDWGTKSWNFNIAQLAPFVNSAAATSVASTSATLNGEVTFAGSQIATITARGFKYSTNTSFNPASEGTQVTAGTGSGSFNASASGLSSGTTYYYYAYATNSTGTTYSDVKQSFTTTSGVTVPSLTTPTATSITHNSATLGATVTSNGGASLTARGTVYKTSTGVVVTDNAAAEGGTAVSAFSHSRTGLSAQTLYYYKGYATNSAGSALSSEGTFRTLSNPVTGQASGLTSSVSNSTTAITSNVSITIGTAATFPGTGATQGGYLVIYSTGTPSLVGSPNGLAPASAVSSGTIFTTSATNLPSTPSTSINITGLSSCATYNILIVPYTWDGTNASTYNYLTASAPTIQVITGSSAYGGTPWVAGDILDTEFFDYGGQGCAFHEVNLWWCRIEYTN
jgi:hypothetical protein